MKKKIAIGFVTLALITLASGFYIMFHIEKTSAQLKDLLASHQVELVRRNLLEKLNRVQFDFYLIGSRYSRSIDSIVSDVQEMQGFADQCVGCHHSPQMMEKLNVIRSDIEAYKSNLSRVLTMRANLLRVRDEEQRAYQQGERLIASVNHIIIQASSGLAEKTQRSLADIERTKTVLFILLLTGPILLAIFSFTTIRSITKPLNVILDAIGMLKKGNLNFRIETPLKNEFAEVAAAFNEMTRTLNEQLHKMQMTEQMAVCGQLAAGLAHEIKNPLAGIKVAIEVLSDELTVSSDNRDTLQKVVAEIRRLESLMKNFLDFARPPKPQFVRTDINSILETTISFLTKQTSLLQGKTKTTEIVKDFDEHLPQITADPQQLRQVFINLLLNAREAMANRGTVRVKTFYDHSRSIQIDISDSGHGIAPDILNKVFQPFFTTKPKGKGTGLGLSVSQGIARRLGGYIEVRSILGAGTSFTVFLPATEVPSPISTRVAPALVAQS